LLPVLKGERGKGEPIRRSVFEIVTGTEKP